MHALPFYNMPWMVIRTDSAQWAHVTKWSVWLGAQHCNAFLQLTWVAYIHVKAKTFHLVSVQKLVLKLVIIKFINEKQNLFHLSLSSWRLVRIKQRHVGNVKNHLRYILRNCLLVSVLGTECSNRDAVFN